MAVKAEGAALDCFEVTLKCEEGEDDEEAMVVAVIPRPEPMLRVAQRAKSPPPRPSLLEAGGDGCEEPRQQVSWEQEFLVGNGPGGSGRALCMVCGAEIRAPSADTARTHILEQHPHTLDLSPSEKSNILEAWSEGVALLQDFRAEQPSPPHSDSGQEVEVDPDSDPDPAEMPAEIVVLLDSEDNPSLPRRSRPRGLRPLELPDPPSPDSPTETFAAPAEVRHFTDGSFPAGFVLQLFSHTQLRASDSKDSPKEGRVAERGLLQPESPSPAARAPVENPSGILALLCSEPSSAVAVALQIKVRVLVETGGPQTRIFTSSAHQGICICSSSRQECCSPSRHAADSSLPLPLRGFAGRWISRLSACGWRSPRQSASCKTGPSIPRAPRVWEQVTAQTGPRFCRNPAPLSGVSQRQGVACRFLLFGGVGEEALSPFGLSLRAAQLGHLMESKTRCQGRTEEGKVGSIHYDSGTLENVSPR
ncbi:spindlin interactor and repressor of chromatin-binding protein isoform X3 [Balaenoptera acutorostrata]|uniref:Spindlin interactor and repressor of chromatin-binding protein isoform X3 n=1 Tax=Balaenoptera acutorostrata TaxID=9767 RepID=A0A383ZH43_BALAC|nr:spindlin interactor and repressor of chromatin-binding protein isoform X3 [Balaenoptera acutorostrata]